MAENGVSNDISHELSDMVDRQIAARGVDDPRVLKALRATPREAFVPQELSEFAHEDSPLPIGEGQTISQPYIVGRMLELAQIEPGDTVLEVGAGSGYAAAVMSKIARKVHGIERHKPLADRASRTLEKLGYGNVEIHHGDGTKGLPQAAPFDAIVVSAGGANVPKPLQDQLAIGGNLVIPLAADGHQVLVRIHRKGEDDWIVEEHGAVAFVPLIGEEDEKQASEKPLRDGERSSGQASARGLELRRRVRDPMAQWISSNAHAFDDMDDLAELTDRYRDRKVVCLGEATHGTAEFYEARAAITERLVRKHGFTVIGLEADWPDAAHFDAHARHRTPPEQNGEESPFSRFPRWMWRNAQAFDFVDHIRQVNIDKETRDRAGIYGLDIYSLGASIDAVINYLDDVDPEAARIARERYACLTPWRADPAAYGRMALTRGYRDCEAGVLRILRDLLEKRLDYLARDGDRFFDAEQNARIAAGAEEYYRAIYYGGEDSWNLRDGHMFETLKRLLDHRGPDTKAVVWAHNSHIGDARQTEMSWGRGEYNIGQLCREAFGDEAALIGFGTARGQVAAASDWGGEMEIKDIVEPRRSSFELRCDEAAPERGFLDFSEGGGAPLDLYLERAIGVIYRPESERMSHYFEARPGAQFDAWVWFGETRPIDAQSEEGGGAPFEEFPFGT